MDEGLGFSCDFVVRLYRIKDLGCGSCRNAP